MPLHLIVRSIKAQAKLDLDNELLSLQKQFNNTIDQLEKELNQQSKQNAEERAAAIKKIQQDINIDVKDIALKRLEDLKKEGEADLRQQDIDFQEARKNILDNEKLTAERRQKFIERLEKANKRSILSIEVENMTRELQTMKLLLDLALLSQEEYDKARQQLVQKAAELSQLIVGEDVTTKDKLKKRFTDLKSFIQGELGDLLNIDEDSPEAAALGEIIGSWRNNWSIF
jgi:hypothetical protein